MYQQQAQNGPNQDGDDEDADFADVDEHTTHPDADIEVID